MHYLKEAEATLQNLDQIIATIRRLRDEHKLLEVRLDHFNRKVHLSPQEEFDRKEIQKLKLRTKDRISMLERKFIRA
jgi:hypothetical protein